MKIASGTFLIACLLASQFVYARAACTPFRVHLKVTLPDAPRFSTNGKFASDWEKKIPLEISKIKTQEEFAAAYEQWLHLHPRELTEQERYEWLQCLLYYVKIDTNKNGIPDWSALVDHQPTHVLFPEDPDQDGDGIANVLDADPLLPDIKVEKSRKEIPPHLQISFLTRPAEAILQKRLYDEFGIIAIDHTDEHAAVVLKEFLYLLEHGFTKASVNSLSNIKYVYAFAGHDLKGNVAAFHLKAQALSVGGISSYKDDKISDAERAGLFETLSHEIGHAVVFQKLSASELQAAASRFGGWEKNDSVQENSLLASVFFKPFPFQKRKNIVSQYAMKNIHEWFAESFAANILSRMGHLGSLGFQWRLLLNRAPANKNEYWTDYGNLSSDYRAWLDSVADN